MRNAVWLIDELSYDEIEDEFIINVNGETTYIKSI